MDAIIQKSKTEELALLKQLAEQKIPSESLCILKDPEIFQKIMEIEFPKKIVGEKESVKVIFLCAAGGRLVKNAQIASYNLLINDDAGAGKDYITHAVLSILPQEHWIHKTRISPTVFNYWHNAKFDPAWTWDGKIFYPEDISDVVLNSEPFKLMASKGSSAVITINNMAVELEIKGKPVLITTSASATPNPELTRRFVILNLDSSESQTRAIMRRHSEYKAKGLIPEYDPAYTEALKHLQRVSVKIPFAEAISAGFPSQSIIMRTHYPRFLDFISASAALHQFQRERDTEGFILATWKDYDLARTCFLKLCSNRYMIPLTINQKKILAVFEQTPYLRNCVTKLSSKMNFLSDRALAVNLRILAKYGLLQIGNDKDAMNRDVEVFSLADGFQGSAMDFSIPTSQEICEKTSLSSTSSISSISSISSASQKDSEDSEDTEVPKCPQAVRKPLQKSLINHKCVFCGQTPCITFNSSGRPICETCLHQPVGEDLADGKVLG